jgi:hypothetical protein
MLVELGSGGSQSIDSTTSKAHRCAAGERGAHEQAIGRCRGGRTTKIHAVANASGRLIKREGYLNPCAVVDGFRPASNGDEALHEHSRLSHTSVMLQASQ